MRAQRGDTKGDVRRVLPVMADGRVGIIHRRWPMHERGRAECRFARITEIDIRAKIVIELLRQTQ